MIIPEFPNHMSSQLNLEWPLIEATLCNVSTSSNVKKKRVLDGLILQNQSPNLQETS